MVAHMNGLEIDKLTRPQKASLLGELLIDLLKPNDSDSAPVKLYSAAEVAAMLSTTKAAVYEAARRGVLGSVRASAKARGGRAVRFTKAQIDEFIERRSREAV